MCKHNAKIFLVVYYVKGLTITLGDYSIVAYQRALAAFGGNTMTDIEVEFRQ